MTQDADPPAADAPPAHPSAQLDDLVHQRARLGILIVLSEAGSAEFTYLAAQLGLTNGNLNRHLAVLETAGLVTVDKRFEGRRPKTWLTLTATGRRALRHEISTLRAIVDGVVLP